jgi:hypothetical protein
VTHALADFDVEINYSQDRVDIYHYERRGRFEVSQSDILRGLIYVVNQNHEFSLRAERSNSVYLAQRIERLCLRTYNRHKGLF